VDGCRRARVGAGMLAGLAGGAAFAAVMKLDIALSRQRVDDFQLLAGFGPLAHRWRVTGAVVHAVNSATLGAVYALVSGRLPGPGWLRGVSFATIENLALWPIIIVLDRVHPAIRSGALPSYNRPWPFIAEVLRHLAYGFILGSVHERLTRAGDCPRASRCSSRLSDVLRLRRTSSVAREPRQTDSHPRRY
jgi:hypothetical protein